MNIIELLHKGYSHCDKHEVFWATSNFEISLPQDNFEVTKIHNYHSDACFSDLGKVLHGNKHKYVYVGFYVNTGDFKLAKADMIAWINLSKKYGTLPAYINARHCIGENKEGVMFIQFRLSLLELHNMQHLYIYLSTMRYLREDPALVKLVLMLTERYNVDYFAALQASVDHFVDWTAHSILDTEVFYTEKAKTFFSYELKKAKALKHFVEGDFGKPELHGVYGNKQWNMFATINRLAGTIKSYKIDIFGLVINTGAVDKYMSEPIEVNHD